jgi:hypothetical protein
MPKVTMRECPFTGELVAGDKKYAQHLREVRETLKGKRERRRAERALRQYCREATANIESAEELRTFVENIPNHDGSIILKLWNQANGPERQISDYGDPYVVSTVDLYHDGGQIRWDFVVEHRGVYGYENIRNLVALVLNANELELFRSGSSVSRVVVQLLPPEWPGLMMGCFQDRLAK